MEYKGNVLDTFATFRYGETVFITGGEYAGRIGRIKSGSDYDETLEVTLFNADWELSQDVIVNKAFLILTDTCDRDNVAKAHMKYMGVNDYHWGNDSEHPIEDWRDEVQAGDTMLSYHEWKHNRKGVNHA